MSNLQIPPVVVGILALARAAYDPRPGGFWHSPWLLAVLGSAAAWLALLIWRIRVEARQTQRPMTSMATFTSTAFGVAVMAASLSALFAGFILNDGTAGSAVRARTASALLGLLYLRLLSARIVIINKLPRQRREPPAATALLLELEQWSRRHLGQWWAAEMGFVAAVCSYALVSASMFLPTLLFIMTPGSGQRLYVAWAHNRGLEWPGREAQQQAAARWHEWQNRAELRALQAKYKKLEFWSACFALAGLLLPYAAVGLFFSDYDARNAWIIGLMISGVLGWPTAFIIVAMLVRGRAYWESFVVYFWMVNGEQGAKMLVWMATGSLLLTVACATGLLVSVMPVAGVSAH